MCLTDGGVDKMGGAFGRAPRAPQAGETTGNQVESASKVDDDIVRCWSG